MNGQQLHRVLVVPASVSQPKFYLLLYPGTSEERAGEGDKSPRATVPMAEEGAGGRDRHDVGKRFLPPLSGPCWWGNTGSDGEGCLLELISRFKSLKLAFSKSQQYKALFFLQSFKEACKYIEVYISMCC